MEFVIVRKIGSSLALLAASISIGFLWSLPSPASAQAKLGLDAPLGRAALRLSVREPESAVWDLGLVQDIAVDPAGRVYVLDSYNRNLRVFDPRGNLLATLGRRGGGPGEFVDVTRLAVHGDTVFVVDATTNRVTFFVGLVGPGRTLSLMGVPGGIRADPSIVSVTASGLLGLVPVASVSPSSKYGTIVSHIVAMDRRGRIKDTIWAVRKEPRTFSYPVRVEGTNMRPTGRGGANQPFPDFPIVRVVPSTGLVVLDRTVPPGSRVGAEIGISYFAFNGTLERSIRLGYDPVPLTDGAFERAIEKILNPSVRPGSFRTIPDRKAVLDSVYRPRFWPHVADVIVGSGGEMLLKSGGEAAGTRLYWMVSRLGSVECAINLPIDFSALALSRGSVWGWRRDSEGVVVVERYDIAAR